MNLYVAHFASDQNISVFVTLHQVIFIMKSQLLFWLIFLLTTKENSRRPRIEAFLLWTFIVGLVSSVLDSGSFVLPNRALYQ